MGPYQNLVVWKKSMVLAKDIFDVTARFPQSETFGLELETQLILSRDFEYLNEEESSMLIQLNEQVNKMLSSLIYTRKESDEIK